MLKLRDGIVELYRKVAVSVPPDIENALRSAHEKCKKGSEEERTLLSIIENISSSRANNDPACEDTGIPIFRVRVPMGISQKDIESNIADATRVATQKIPLKASAIDSITGVNSGDNTGAGFPIIYMEESSGTNLTVELTLSCSNSENIGQIYTLPEESLKARRDLDGVGKCVIDAVKRANGRGCPPYVVGVGIGATTDQAALLCKKQNLRRLSDTNSNHTLSSLEDTLLEDINKLGIGPLGRGGLTTALGVRIGAGHRHTDTYIVGVSLSCWADRRGKLIW
jgi:fumarate hydratase class I